MILPGTTATRARSLGFLVCAVAVLTSAVVPAAAAPRARKRAPTATPAVAPAPPAAPATPGPASADRATPPEKRRMIGILDVRVEGVPDDVKAAFERGLEEQLDTKLYWLSTRAQMRERMKFSTKWTEGCLIGACLEELRAQTSAEIVLLAAFNGSGTSFGHVVTLVRTDNGRVLSQESGRCEVCTVNEAMAGATLATMRLLSAVPDVLPGEPAATAAPDGQMTKVEGQLASARKHHRREGLVLTLLGLAVAGAGVGLYYLNDKPDYALAIAAGGGGLTLGGVVVLTF